MFKKLCLVATIIFSVSGIEKILNFHSDITVQKDSTIIVKESITVNCEGREICRGIKREFPTRYTFEKSIFTVPFKVLSVKRNGVPTDYHITDWRNGKIVWIMKEGVYLPHGTYTFEITYETAKQIYFGKDYDELYFNVTGNGWPWYINKASAVVTLPEGVPKDKIQLYGYTGYQDSKGDDYVAKLLRGKPYFATTSVLYPRQGLTISATWPKGFVNKPTFIQEATWLFQENLWLLWGILFLLLALVFLIISYHRIPKPDKAKTVPLFKPPNNLTAAEVACIYNKGHALGKDLAAQIVQYAVQGFIRIEKEKGFWRSCLYTLHRTGADRAEEPALVKQLFGSSKTVILSRSNSKLQKLFKDFAKKERPKATGYTKFYLNNWLVVLALTAIGIIPQFIAPTPMIGLFLGAGMFLVVMAGVAYARYSASGIKIMEQILGFRMFLDATEKERLAFTSSPERTPQQYEKFLPYAMALGCERSWSEQFAPMFAQLEKAGTPYVYSWHTGGHPVDFGSGSYSSSFANSFTSAISSSASVPGSSSGAGGGGSSGGGGGGGGGGGC